MLIKLSSLIIYKSRIDIDPTARQLKVYQGATFIPHLLMGNHSGLCMQLIHKHLHNLAHAVKLALVIHTYTFAVFLHDFPQFLNLMRQIELIFSSAARAICGEVQ